MSEETEEGASAEPSSHETSGQFPADDVAGDVEPGGAEPSSHDTAEQFPAEQVAGQSAPAPAPEPEPEASE